jgi:spore coat polysaccharide biosynthesis predicted glycosyltransferase SpsG
MTRPALVELYCDGGPGLGYGHIRRARTLAAQLERDGVEVRLDGLSPVARSLLPPPGSGQGRSKVVIFDAPGGLDGPIAQAQAGGQCVVSLDWFGATVPDVNIVIYPHQEVRALRRSYIGLDYVLVRDEIASLPRDTGVGQGVLIVLGGGDVRGAGHDVAGRISRWGLDVTLVQGPLASDTSPAQGYRVLVDPPGLPQLYAQCRWAVTNGGGCMFEAMCAGKAAVALPQTAAEARVAAWALRQGGLLGIGMEALRNFTGDEIGPVGTRGAALVDGRGAQRVSEIIRGVL